MSWRPSRRRDVVWIALDAGAAPISGLVDRIQARHAKQWAETGRGSATYQNVRTALIRLEASFAAMVVGKTDGSVEGQWSGAALWRTVGPAEGRELYEVARAEHRPPLKLARAAIAVGIELDVVLEHGRFFKRTIERTQRGTVQLTYSAMTWHEILADRGVWV